MQLCLRAHDTGAIVPHDQSSTVAAAGRRLSPLPARLLRNALKFRGAAAPRIHAGAAAPRIHAGGAAPRIHAGAAREAQGGRTGVESVPGQVATVFFTLPEPQRQRAPAAQFEAERAA